MSDAGSVTRSYDPGCGGGGVVSNDHVVDVRDEAREQGESEEAHRDAAGEERAATACEPDDGFDLRHGDGDGQPDGDGEKEKGRRV